MADFDVTVSTDSLDRTVKVQLSTIADSNIGQTAAGQGSLSLARVNRSMDGGGEGRKFVSAYSLIVI